LLTIQFEVMGYGVDGAIGMSEFARRKNVLLQSCRLSAFSLIAQIVVAHDIRCRLAFRRAEMAFLAPQGLTKHYRAVVAVADIDLAIERGESILPMILSGVTGAFATSIQTTGGLH